MSTIALYAIAALLWFVWRQLEGIALSLQSLREIAEHNHRRKHGEESQEA